MAAHTEFSEKTCLARRGGHGVPPLQIHFSSSSSKIALTLVGVALRGHPPLLKSRN